MSRSLTGVVASNKNDKTIVIAVATHKTHPLYKKKYVSTKRYAAHDEKNEASVGDKVVIVETRPISANKRFKLDKIIERAALSEEQLEVVKVEEKTDDKTEEKK
jgi:small subunit ribosomal protein S17